MKGGTSALEPLSLTTVDTAAIVSGSRPPPVDPLDHIRSYYRALNTGDTDLVASHFTDDAVHYYTRLGPHEGARAIAENATWAVETIDGQWWFEHGMADGDEAVIEWTMTWRDPKSGDKRLTAGRSGSACATDGSPRCAPTTTATARTPRVTCSASTTRGAATRRSRGAGPGERAD